jgi:hypothetical protein
MQLKKSLIFKTSCLFFLMLISQGRTLRAQAFDQAVLLGKACPEAYYPRVLNNGGKGLRLSSLRGKPFLLYFYSIRCMACLRSFPRVDSLQSYFGDRVTILLVGRESKAAVQKVLKERATLRGLHLKTVVEDGQLNQVFRFTSVPHIVWVDREGIVRAITGEVSRESLQEWLTTGQVPLQEKRDAVGKRSEDPQLYTDYTYHRDPGQVLLYGYVTRSIRATSSVNGWTTGKSGELVRIKETGSVRGLYHRLYRLKGLNPNSIVVEDSALARDGATYTCDFIQHKGWSKEAFLAYARSYLDQFFAVKSRVEVRGVKCWVIRRTTPELMLSTRGDKFAEETRGGNWILTNHTWAGLLFNLNARHLQAPCQVVDETGIPETQSLDMVLPVNLKELLDFQRALAPYGLSVTEEERERETVVVRGVEKQKE